MELQEDVFHDVYNLLQAELADGIVPLVRLQAQEADLAAIMPGWSAKELDGGLSLVDVFSQCYKQDDVGVLVGEFMKQEEEQEEEEDEEEDLGYLSKDMYLEMQTIFFVMNPERKKELPLSRLTPNEMKKLSDLFGVHLETSDPMTFKRLDKDRTGMVSAFELLRALLPDIPAHQVKAAMQKYDSHWKKLKKELIKEAEQQKEMEEEEEEEEEEEGEEVQEVTEVIDPDSYDLCKETFEDIDADESGEVSCKEIEGYLSENTIPFFGEKLNWKLLDKDRNGYVSFEEFIRACYGSVPQWKLRKDIKILQATHGLPAGTSKAAKKKPAKTPVIQELPAVRRKTGQLMLRTPSARINIFDSRIKQLEDRLQLAESEAKAFERSRFPQRNVLTGAEQTALNNKLYYYQLERMNDAELKRAEYLSESGVGQGSRWMNTTKLSGESVDELNTRFYDDPLATIGEKRQQMEASLEQEPPKTIDAEELLNSVQRLYTSDIVTRKEKRDLLMHKYHKRPASRVASPEVCIESSKRLYTEGVNRKSAKQEMLVKKYILDAQLPQVRLSKAQQEKMVSRLAKC